MINLKNDHTNDHKHDRRHSHSLDHPTLRRQSTTGFTREEKLVEVRFMQAVVRGMLARKHRRMAAQAKPEPVRTPRVSSTRDPSHHFHCPSLGVTRAALEAELAEGT